jgi:hypothetical protein
MATAPSALTTPDRGGNAMNVLGNMMNWDPVAWMSILMVAGSIVVVVFLYFKVRALIQRDAEAHKNQQ